MKRKNAFLWDLSCHSLQQGFLLPSPSRVCAQGLPQPCVRHLKCVELGLLSILMEAVPWTTGPLTMPTSRVVRRMGYTQLVKL